MKYTFEQKESIIKALDDITAKFQAYIYTTCPFTDETRIAIEKLCEAKMWAQSSIFTLRNE